MLLYYHRISTIAYHLNSWERALDILYHLTHIARPQTHYNRPMLPHRALFDNTALGDLFMTFPFKFKDMLHITSPGE